MGIRSSPTRPRNTSSQLQQLSVCGLRAPAARRGSRFSWFGVYSAPRVNDRMPIPNNLTRTPCLAASEPLYPAVLALPPPRFLAPVTTHKTTQPPPLQLLNAHRVIRSRSSRPKVHLLSCHWINRALAPTSSAVVRGASGSRELSAPFGCSQLRSPTVRDN
jgi:hypothetical protein